MRRRPFSILTLILSLATTAAAQEAPSVSPIRATATLVGDAEGGVATRFSVELDPAGVDPAVPLFLQGSVSVDGRVLRTLRYTLAPNDRSRFRFVQVIPPGAAEIEIRLMAETADRVMLLGKETVKISVAPVGSEYLATAEDGVEGMLAEGVAAETAGAVKILPPKRDIAPHLFLVDVEVQSPVKRVEFYVDGKRIITKNSPPYRAELDLGRVPRRVEVRAVGYDSRGRYVDADAWIVNERENLLELKITRHVEGEISHFKVSLQNSRNTPIANVAFFAGDRRLANWKQPPFAIRLTAPQLAGVEFVRASAFDEAGTELAADLLFLDGSRFIEEIDVNLIELPVSVADRAGNSIAGLAEKDFTVLENGKPQKIASFNFATNLPLSLGLLVDYSGSMKPRIEATREAAVKFYAQILRPQDRAFFGAFSWEATNISPFVASADSLRAQIDAMPEPEGGTALYDAIIAGLYRFRSVSGRRALVIVTDGDDTVSRTPYKEMLEYVRAARVPIYFIGIGISPLSGSPIRTLAAETGGTVYMIRDIEQLEPTYRKLEEELRTQYVIGYYAEVTKKDTAYRTVEVKVARPDVVVRTIRGYLP